MFAAPLLLATLVAAGPAAAAPAADAADAAADQWPRFRGPDGAGAAAGGRFPATFTPADFAWSTPLKGTGVSSPAVWGDRVFVTAADGPRRLLYRIDAASGAVVWEKDVKLNPDGPPAEPGLHAKNDPASATPTADATRVFTTFSDGQRVAVQAFDQDGKELWRTDLGGFVGQHGHGASPVRVDVPPADLPGPDAVRELVVLTNDQDGSGGVVALDAATGETVWSSPRDSREVAYSTPIVLRRPGKPLALLTASGAAGIVALDAASGAELWRTGEFPSRVVASPALAGGLAWAQCGSGGAGKLLIGVDVESGEVKHERTRSLPYVPTPVAANGLLFLWGDRGVVTALDPADGEALWAERVGGNYSGSPVAIGDTVLCVAEDGTVAAVAASEEFELRGRSPLGGPSAATPAVAGGRVFFRLEDRLICLPLEAPATW